MTASRKKIMLLATVAVILICVVSVFLCMDSKKNEVSLEDVRNELLSQLEEREGEYDAYSIVLSNTSKSAAEALAEKVGAQLRINKDGSFATLTLTDGRTVKDVYSDAEYLQDIEAFSTDWNATISDIFGQEDALCTV